MSIEDLTEQERSLVRKITGASLLFDPNFEKWIVDRVLLNIGNMPIGQLGGGRGIARVLKKDATTQTLTTATGGNTSFFSYPLKAKMLAQHGELFFKMFFKAFCSDASNTLRIRLRMGGSEVCTLDLDTSVMDGLERHGIVEFRFANMGAYNSNHALGRFVYDFEPNSQEKDVEQNAVSTLLAIDTSTDKDFEVALQWISAGSMSFTKLYASLQVFNPIDTE